MRTAVPYSAELTQSLRADNTYIYFSIALTLLLGSVLYISTRRISRHIGYLREFAIKAENGEPLDHELERHLPDDELGDISHTIIMLYWKLRHAEEDKARLKRQLTQNAAHELKTPAMSIHGYLESILDDTALALQQKGIAARLTMPRQVIIAAIQEYANMVSIGRLGLNDHGPVHMKTVCRNALKMLSILHAAGMQTSLEKENIGTFADSVAAVMLASLLHDSGMTIGRKGHELYSGIISYPIVEKVLSQLLPEDFNILRRTIIRSIAIEGIIGHMATHPIHSVEAGIILIADGCDMTKGRARIPLEIPSKPAEGDIHKYSANSIEKVKIGRGNERPLKIEIHMRAEVGFFQVEEVLIPKIQSSPVKSLLELYAGVEGEEMKRYM